MYPRLIVDLDKVFCNVKQVVDLCGTFGISVCGVTKAVCGDPRIVQAFVDGGVASLGDSRLDHILRYKQLELPKVLIRAPQIQDAAGVVENVDVSVNTEIEAMNALEDACSRLGVRRHGVMLMVDLGDLREGIIERREFEEAVRFIESSKHLFLYGVGANLNCLSFILPDERKMDDLLSFVRLAGETVSVADLVVSGGNSSNINLMRSGSMPSGVNSLRLGESLLFGRERAGYDYLPGTHNDAFVLQAVIVELKEKPSAPWGTSGVDSYGQVHSYEDRGVRRRALLAFGHQDIDTGVLWPIDKSLRIIDSSSDYTVVDVTDSGERYRVGDVIEFRCGYHAVARAFASPYIDVIFANSCCL